MTEVLRVSEKNVKIPRGKKWRRREANAIVATPYDGASPLLNRPVEAAMERAKAIMKQRTFFFL